MTRKDYQLVAMQIRITRDLMPVAIKGTRPMWVEANYDIDKAMIGVSDAAIDYVAYTLAQAFNEENPKFDIKRFLDDCGAEWREEWVKP